MFVKIVHWITLTFVMWMIINNSVCFSAVETKPYKDSFDVVQSHTMSHLEILDTVYDAEQARILHRNNLTAISKHMQSKFTLRYDKTTHCIVNIGEISGTIWALPHFIYLKSDTNDNMYILCTSEPSTSIGDGKLIHL